MRWYIIIVVDRTCSITIHGPRKFLQHLWYDFIRPNGGKFKFQMVDAVRITIIDYKILYYLKFIINVFKYSNLLY